MTGTGFIGHDHDIPSDLTADILKLQNVHLIVLLQVELSALKTLITGIIGSPLNHVKIRSCAAEPASGRSCHADR